jgi:hypothetical protein
LHKFVENTTGYSALDATAETALKTNARARMILFGLLNNTDPD